MSESRNPNHPKIGSETKVQPIISVKDIKSIKKMLSGKPRDLALFVLGINTNLRASDLLNIKVGSVRSIQADDELVLTEIKTGKERRINLNAACVQAIQNHLAVSNLDDEDFLFKSRKGDAIGVMHANKMVKSWCNSINLTGNYGSHSLRKTWGYHQRVTFGVDLPTLMTCFNHSTQKQTLQYLCVQADEVRNVYKNQL